MKKIKKFLLLILIFFVTFFVFLFLYINASLKPVTSEQEYQEIIIQESWYGKKVLSYLQDEGVIRNSNVAYYYLRFKSIDMDFKAGKYLIDKSLSLEEIINYLQDASNTIQDTVNVKLIEGYRLKDYAKIIAEATNLDYDELLNYWNNESVLEKLAAEYPFIKVNAFTDDVKYLLEGYLFPDTYELFINTTNEDVTRKILNNTKYYFDKYSDYFDSSNYSIHEIFTLASIIQRESGNNEDMKDISSVFYNRLDAGMQMQSSVTVCYSLDIGVEGDWTKCEITQTNYDPYNTYQIVGFPPGPICSFNEDALIAALMPNETDYYFFIGDVCESGETIFAKTYAEQLDNQARYLTCY